MRDSYKRDTFFQHKPSTVCTSSNKLIFPPPQSHGYAVQFFFLQLSPLSSLPSLQSSSTPLAYLDSHSLDL
ncbi:hypothetical protein ACTXT7_013240 [Hymenolepis weldensis]